MAVGVPYDIGDLIDKVYKYSNLGEYLNEENRLLQELVPRGSALIDFGCGNGRHLRMLEPRLKKGFGIDIDLEHIESARKLNKSNILNFIVADAKKYIPENKYDVAISMYNTMGNIYPPGRVLANMQKACVAEGRIIVSVFSDNSIEERIEFYQKIGFGIKKVTEKSILTDKGVRSDHYSESRLASLIPGAEIIPCSRFGRLAVKFL
ncbi:class I SAM-dependent methyltransferase [Microbulbifer variabilis]|uniref:class I SAM-dependent methyltransferase n=1 Tax=Microbulbifer variabilis TaxID=266805 RepID=UPI001CFCA0EA|nr:class I SAM-dependent methyltransferase [Microbulbifer variabilis]